MCCHIPHIADHVATNSSNLMNNTWLNEISAMGAKFLNKKKHCQMTMLFNERWPNVLLRKLFGKPYTGVSVRKCIDHATQLTAMSRILIIPSNQIIERCKHLILRR